jgi:hypothetical protein
MLEQLLNELDVTWDSHIDGDANIETCTLNKVQMYYIVSSITLLIQKETIEEVLNNVGSTEKIDGTSVQILRRQDIINLAKDKGITLN